MTAASSLLRRIQTLVETPTAPFREDWMADVLDRELAAIPGVEVAVDRFGNRVARLRRGNPAGAPATFVAHLDHPGFIFPRDGGARPLPGTENRYEARFEGRVFDEYFPNAPVRFFRSPHDPGVPGRVIEADALDSHNDLRRAILQADGDATGAVLAMWDVPVFSVDDGLIRARVCDDLAGCGSMIEALARLSREPEIDVCMIFSRAEEAGFCGVVCMLGEEEFPPLVPRDTVFVSVEISSETGPIVLGDGAVIRIGDRSSTFDGATVDMLWRLAHHRKISARRALMDKGTCEATPFSRAGFRAGGVCAPVRHYHNMDQNKRVIAPEMVAVGDVEALVELIAGLAVARSLNIVGDPVIRGDYDLFLRKGRAELVPDEQSVGAV